MLLGELAGGVELHLARRVPRRGGRAMRRGLGGGCRARSSAHPQRPGRRARRRDDAGRPASARASRPAAARRRHRVADRRGVRVGQDPLGVGEFAELCQRVDEREHAPDRVLREGCGISLISSARRPSASASRISPACTSAIARMKHPVASAISHRARTRRVRSARRNDRALHLVRHRRSGGSSQACAGCRGGYLSTGRDATARLTQRRRALSGLV